MTTMNISFPKALKSFVDNPRSAIYGGQIKLFPDYAPSGPRWCRPVW